MRESLQRERPSNVTPTAPQSQRGSLVFDLEAAPDVSHLLQRSVPTSDAAQVHRPNGANPSPRTPAAQNSRPQDPTNTQLRRSMRTRTSPTILTATRLGQVDSDQAVPASASYQNFPRAYAAAKGDPDTLTWDQCMADEH